ncbi:hypothetical protein D7Z54_05195 [Salibacterium salarium]|uniref:YqhG n=1 Tax=Salibacterium salarium TaxID=284579 RepID=A0A428N847_9BACI|nr:YqhG family protein [Salibacterium salarium]RSL34540.1 hypothetical protein D7Z54_05195 [Salibacterium salarium]
MENNRLLRYLYRYFTANHAAITYEDNRKMEVQLTEELDQELINRPFYWQYIKKTGGIPQPMTLHFIIDGKRKEQEKGELLHFGSPRLHQIFRSAQQRGRWTLLYENSRQTSTASPLFPWLMVNVKISYVSHQRKDHIISYGLQLIHGQLVENMMNRLNQKTMNTVIPNHSFPMASLIQASSGLRRVKHKIEQSLQEETHEWAAQAVKRMNDEIDILDRYYHSSSQSPEEYELEKKAIIHRYHPQIEVKIINSGLIYLTETAM